MPIVMAGIPNGPGTQTTQPHASVLPTTMAQPQVPFFPRLSSADRFAVAPEVLLDFSRNPGVYAAIENYLGEAVPMLFQRHATHMDDIRRIQAFLDNRNPDAPARLGVANFNTPLMLWHRNAAANRLERSIFAHAMPATLAPTGRKKGDLPLVGALNNLGNFVAHAIHNPRMLNGKDVVSDVICDMTDTGVGAWAVVLSPDEIDNMPERVGSVAEEFPRRGDGDE